MPFFTYVLQCQSTGNFYKGHTNSLETRLREHNTGKTRSTKSGTPWCLVYSEEFETRKEAMAREKYFKTAAGRRFIKTLNL